MSFHRAMTEEMRTNFGYDDLGNCEELLAEKDRQALEAGISRAGGDATCRCGTLLKYHPPVQGALWATRGCDELVKL